MEQILGRHRQRQLKRLRIGVRAHDFGRLSAGELAAQVAARGLSAVQLAPGKALAGWEGFGPGQLDARMARDAGQALARQGIEISVLGCYINPIHPELQVHSPK